MTRFLDYPLGIADLWARLAHQAKYYANHGMVRHTLPLNYEARTRVINAYAMDRNYCERMGFKVNDAGDIWFRDYDVMEPIVREAE